MVLLAVKVPADNNVFTRTQTPELGYVLLIMFAMDFR